MKSIYAGEQKEIVPYVQGELLIKKYFEKRIFPEELSFLRGFTWGVIFSVPLWSLIIIALMKVY